jgi:hypothetical protein
MTHTRLGLALVVFGGVWTGASLMLHRSGSPERSSTSVSLKSRQARVRVTGRILGCPIDRATLVLHFPSLPLDLSFPPEKLGLSPSGAYRVSAQVPVPASESRLSVWAVASAPGFDPIEQRDLVAQPASPTGMDPGGEDTWDCAAPGLSLVASQTPRSPDSASSPAPGHVSPAVPANRAELIQHFRHAPKGQFP